jgi:hypothetical protein
VKAATGASLLQALLKHTCILPVLGRSLLKLAPACSSSQLAFLKAYLSTLYSPEDEHAWPGAAGRATPGCTTRRPLLIGLGTGKCSSLLAHACCTALNSGHGLLWRGTCNPASTAAQVCTGSSCSEQQPALLLAHSIRLKPKPSLGRS